MANSDSDKRGYHHGDLRAALIEAGLALLADRSADDIGLREAARAVGVSATAVYRHFPDKGAFLAALAGEGLRQLGAAQRVAAEAAGGGERGFAATGAAYVRFAIANPRPACPVLSVSPAGVARRWKGKKISGRSPSGIPSPVSSTRMSTCSPARRHPTTTRLSGQWLSALEMKLPSTH